MEQIGLMVPNRLVLSEPQCHQGVHLAARPSPFRADTVRMVLPFGFTIQDLVLNVIKDYPAPLAYGPCVVVWLDGEDVPIEMWGKIKPREGHLLEMAWVPNDSNLPKEANLRSILTIFTSIGGMLLGSFVIGGPWGAVAGSLISIAGMFLWNALIPIPQVFEPSRPNLTGAGNSLTPYAVLPYVAGRYRVTPKQAARTYTSLEGDDQVMHVLLAMCKGDGRISSIKVGQTPIEQLQGIAWQFFNSNQINESIFKNDVQELTIGAIARGWVKVTCDGGNPTINVGEAIDHVFGIVRVWDKDNDSRVEWEDFSVDNDSGTLTYIGNGGEWPAGSSRFEVVFWPRDRAVIRTTVSSAESISLELDWLQGFYKKPSNSETKFEEARVDFNLQYRMHGTADNGWLPYLTFGARQDVAVAFGGGNTLQIPIAPVSRIQRVRDMTGNSYPAIPRDLAPSEYVVDLDNGTIARADGHAWATPPWFYMRQQHLVLPIMRDVQLLFAPIEPGTSVKMELWNGVSWQTIDPDDYSVDMATGKLHWDGVLPIWPIANWGLYIPPYRATYSGAVPLTQVPARWKIVYQWDPLDVAASKIDQATALDFLVTARGYVNQIVADVKAAVENDRQALSSFRAIMLKCITRIMQRAPLIDPTGADPVLQPIIDALVDLNANSAGLGELRALMEDYAECFDPEDSPIALQNDRTAHIVTAIDALVSIHIYRGAMSPGDSLTPILAEVERFCHVQVALDPLFGEPYYAVSEFNFRDSTQAIARRTLYWHTLPAPYDVAITRMPGKKDNGDWNANYPPVDDEDNDYVTEVTVGALRALGVNKPVLEPNCMLLALRINASERLTGAIDNISAIVEQPTPVWHDDTKTWVTEITRNPAWHYLRVLLGYGGVNARPVQANYPVWNNGAWVRDRIDMPAFIEWAAICEERNWHVDYDFEEEDTTFAALKLIAAAGRAAFGMRDSRYSIVVDKDQTAMGYAQLFSPRNVKNFEVSVAYVDMPHALKVQFKDEAVEYQANEVVVYDDGYNEDGTPDLEIDDLDGGAQNLAVLWGPIATEQQAATPGAWGVDSVIDNTTGNVVPEAQYTVDYEAGTLAHAGAPWGAGAGRWKVTYWGVRQTATKFEQTDLPGCTSASQAWRHGRYLLAVARLRPRQFTWACDWEQLRCNRGDLVGVQHYVPLLGLHSGARISEVTLDEQERVVGIKVDDYWRMENGKEYAVQIRYRDSHVELLGVVTVQGDSIDTLTLQGPAPTSPNGLKIQPGDLVAFGEAAKVTRDVVVTEIKQDRYLGAKITGVDHAPEVHLAETHPIPDFDPGITEPPPDTLFVPDPPVVVSIASDETVMTRAGDRLVANILINLQTPPPNVGDTEPPAFIQFEWRRYSTQGDGTWTRQSEVPIDARQVMLTDVVEAGAYDLRVRYRTALSRLSEWTSVWEYIVIGRSSPPPDVTEFRIDAGRVLRWTYPNPPIDLAGFEIRWLPVNDLPYPDDIWADAVAVHGGLVTTLEYGLPTEISGKATFFIRALDSSEHYSRKSAYIVTNLGDPSLENIVVLQDEHGNGFSQEVIAGVIDEETGDLVGDYASEDLFWTGTDEDLFWTGADEDLFWMYMYNYVAYSFSVNPPSGSENSALTVWMEATVPDGSEMVVFYSSSDSGEEALPFPGRIVVKEGIEYTFTVALSAFHGETSFLVRPRISALVAVIDVADIEERFEDLRITNAAAGLRLPLQKQYHQIVNVTLTLQDSPGDSAIGMRLIDKEFPPSQAGPLVKAYNDLGSTATATFDAIVKGY